jgi:hypothetical protein
MQSLNTDGAIEMDDRSTAIQICNRVAVCFGGLREIKYYKLTPFSISECLWHTA